MQLPRSAEQLTYAIHGDIRLPHSLLFGKCRLRPTWTVVSSPGSMGDQGYDVDVVVVGGGPTGLLLALDLHRHGVTSLKVLEQRPEPALQDKTKSKAVAIHARTVEILEDIGVLPEFLEQGLQCKAMQMMDEGVVIMENSLERAIDSRFNFVLSLPQYDTETILQNRCKEKVRCNLCSSIVSTIGLTGIKGYRRALRLSCRDRGRAGAWRSCDLPPWRGGSPEHCGQVGGGMRWCSQCRQTCTWSGVHWRGACKAYGDAIHTL